MGSFNPYGEVRLEGCARSPSRSPRVAGFRVTFGPAGRWVAGCGGPKSRSRPPPIRLRVPVAVFVVTRGDVAPGVIDRPASAVACHGRRRRLVLRIAPALAASATLKTNRLRARLGTGTPPQADSAAGDRLRLPNLFRSRSPISNAKRNLENHGPTNRSTMSSAKVTLNPYRNVSD